jgi:hypothetical protein
MFEAVARGQGGCLEVDERAQGPYRGRDGVAVAKATVTVDLDAESGQRVSARRSDGGGDRGGRAAMAHTYMEYVLLPTWP